VALTTVPVSMRARFDATSDTKGAHFERQIRDEVFHGAECRADRSRPGNMRPGGASGH
jgi:hypothetical protein